MTALAIGLAVLVGISLGSLGGGGSILAVPLLVYVAGMDARAAIATSLLVVGATSATAALSHARAGRVQWRTGGVFGLAGMAGAYGGGRIGTLVDGSWLLVGFAAMMAVTAAAMLRPRTPRGPTPDRHRMPVWKILLEGVAVGVVTGLVGAGGGFLVVPALVLLGGVPMHVAVGTSLVVIAMKSMAGLAGYLSGIEVDWPLALAVTAAAVSGSLVGGRLVAQVPQERLRHAFGWFVAIMAVVVLCLETPAGVGSAVLTSPLTWVALAGAAVAGMLVNGGDGRTLRSRAAAARSRRGRPTTTTVDRCGRDVWPPRGP